MEKCEGEFDKKACGKDVFLNASINMEEIRLLQKLGDSVTDYYGFEKELRKVIDAAKADGNITRLELHGILEVYNKIALAQEQAIDKKIQEIKANLVKAL